MEGVDNVEHMADTVITSANQASATTGPLTLQIKFSNSSIERDTIYSPVTDLAHNFSEHLTTRNGSFDTPKRKLSLGSIGDTPTPVRPSSFRSQLHRPPSVDQGCFVDTPSPSPSEDSTSPCDESPYSFTSLATKNSEGLKSPRSRARKSAFRRFKSLPCGSLSQSFPPDVNLSSPRVSFTIDETELVGSRDSQDSGIGKDYEEAKEEFKFVAPVGFPPRSSSRSFILDEATRSPHKYSPVKDRCISAPAGSLEFCLPTPGDDLSGSPVLLSVSSLTSSMNDDETDDGFLDTHFMDHHELNPCGQSMPAGLSSLLTAPLINKENSEPPTRESITRGLFRSPSVPDFRLRRPSAFKRPDRPKDGISPMQNKRRKSMVDGLDDKSVTVHSSPNVLRELCPQFSQRRLHRCHSESEAMIKSALNKGALQPDLAGDYSKSFCLPTVSGKHQDLRSITPQTLSDLMNDKYSNEVEKYIIIDCRYPYEYAGGHIKGAINVYTRDQAVSEFLHDPRKHVALNGGKRTILIFHCEFSSERAPKMSRFIRKNDREQNVYPNLFYPEMYLLHNGYKHFFETQKGLCEPQTYTPMLHKEHSDDLKHFRTKSKSWAGDCKGRYAFRTGLKF